jgi:hypothetical protein
VIVSESEKVTETGTEGEKRKTEGETEAEGETGKEETEIGIAVKIEKIKIERRREIVKEVVGKGIERTGRGKSEDATLRKILSALETLSQSVGGKQIPWASCKVLMLFRIVEVVKVRYLYKSNFQVQQCLILTLTLS